MDGARGTDSVGDIELGAYANLSQGHGLGFNAIHYDRRSLYDDYPSVHDRFWSCAVHYELEFRVEAGSLSLERLAKSG